MESRRNHFSVSLPIVNSKVWWLIVCWSQVACQLFSMLVSFYSFNSFICLWLCRVFIAARGLSLLEVGGATLLRCSGLSLWRLSCGGAQALGARARLLRRVGSFALGHGSDPCPLPWQRDSSPLCQQGGFLRAGFTWIGHQTCFVCLLICPVVPTG